MVIEWLQEVVMVLTYESVFKRAHEVAPKWMLASEGELEAMSKVRL